MNKKVSLLEREKKIYLTKSFKYKTFININ